MVSYGTGRPAGAVRVIGNTIGGARSVRAFLGALLIGLLSTVFLGISAAPASAHTALKATSPKDGGRIDAAPSELVLEFTEPLLGTGDSVVVAGPDGAQYQAGRPLIVNGVKLTQRLEPLGPAGEYTVEFRVVAYDGHPLTSGMRFTLTKPGPAAGGSTKVVELAPFAEVSGSVNNAPPWASWIGAAAVVILVFGAFLFGRRVTRDLDQ